MNTTLTTEHVNGRGIERSRSEQTNTALTVEHVDGRGTRLDAHPNADAEAESTSIWGPAHERATEAVGSGSTTRDAAAPIYHYHYR